MTMYQLNTNSARKADSEARITEIGAYIGRITLAEAVVSSKGTRGIELSFKRLDGAEAKYLTLWTYLADGTEIFGFSQLCALMTCLKVREISGTKIIIEKYDFTTKKNEKVEVEAFKELMDKPIGVVLDKEPYLSNSGEQKEKMVFKTSFDPETKQTGSEILDNKPAEKVEKLVESLINRPKQPLQAHQNQALASQSPHLNTGFVGQNNTNSFDDDVPF